MNETAVVTTPLPIAMQVPDELTKRYGRQALIPERKQRIETYLSDLRTSTRSGLLGYGLPEQQRAVGLAEQMIKDASKDETTDVVRILDGVQSELKGLDPEEFLNMSQKAWYENLGLGNVPLLTKILVWASEIVGKLPAYALLLKKYQAVATRIAQWEQELTRAQQDGLIAVENGHKLFLSSLEDLRVFEDALVAAEFYSIELDHILKDAKASLGDSPSIDESTAITRMDGRIRAFRRQIDDMASIRSIIQQQVAAFEAGAQTDDEQVQTINTLITHGIPIFKTMTATVIMALKRRKRGVAIKATRTGINSMVRKSASLTRQTVTEAQAQIEQGNFDLDAIEAAQSDILSMFDELEQIREEGERARAEKREALDNLYSELNEAMAKRRDHVAEDSKVSHLAGDGPVIEAEFKEIK